MTLAMLAGSCGHPARTCAPTKVNRSPRAGDRKSPAVSDDDPRGQVAAGPQQRAQAQRFGVGAGVIGQVTHPDVEVRLGGGEVGVGVPLSSCRPRPATGGGAGSGWGGVMPALPRRGAGGHPRPRCSRRPWCLGELGGEVVGGRVVAAGS